MVKHYLAFVLFAIASLSATAQNTNPFELKWKTGTPESTAEVVDTAVQPPAAIVEQDLIQPEVGLNEVEDNSVDVEEVAEEPAIQPEEREVKTEAPITRIAPPGKASIGLILAFLGLALLILTWAVNINRGFLLKIYKAALNENFSALLLREQRFASSQYLYYIVYAVFFLNAGLFLYLVTRYAIWDTPHRAASLFVIAGLIVLVYFLKHIVVRIIGDTYVISKELRHYNFNIVLYNILTGIALMPINLVLAFGPEGSRMLMVYVGLTILGLLYLLRQFRGFIIGSHLILTNVFQFFIYLCAIEILPVLVLFKIFLN